MYNQNIPGRNEAVISLVLGIVGVVAALFVNGLLGSVARESGLADADDGAPQEEPAQP